ncbi:MAG: ABC transporter permease [Anaerolineae bacterium]|nr:ABC transporter permease [Anaerolineae bacterium]MDW8068591.1 ABC transporter permease [Anaerolineae bacterium]
MNFVKRYLIPRLVQYILVVFLGVTAVFLIPRLTPTDPIAHTIAQIRSQGAYLDPATVDEFIQDLKELYGLEGSILDQYIGLWKRLFRGDFGVSFFQFPTRVSELVGRALPWTVGLLLTTTVISWVAGNLVGGLAGYFSRKRWAQALDFAAMVIRPLPYYIFSFTLLLLFGYVIRLFPIAGGAAIGSVPSFTWSYIADVLRHAFLPALSLTILGGTIWFQTMKLIVQNVNAESFVQYAKLGGVKEGIIVSKYVIRNAMLPQITALGLALGQIFSGALITEIVFSYPGLGTLLYNAVITGDYNLIMGITIFSIVAITTAILLLDLLYPLFDPRVRYR